MVYNDCDSHLTRDCSSDPFLIVPGRAQNNQEHDQVGQTAISDEEQPIMILLPVTETCKVMPLTCAQFLYK